MDFPDGKSLAERADRAPAPIASLCESVFAQGHAMKEEK